MVPPLISLQTLDGGREELLPVHIHVVRALPHVAKGLLCADPLQRAPGQPVTGHEDLGLPHILLCPDSLDHVVPAVLLPHLRIPHVTAEIRRVILISHEELLSPHAKAIFTLHQHGVALPSGQHIVVLPVLQLHVTGVIEVHPSVLHKSTSGVGAVAVKGLVRVEGCALVLPVHHIPACAVSPHFHAPLRIEGRILKKRVKKALELAQPIGIVELPCGGYQVDLLAEVPPGRRCLLRQLHQLL